MRRYLIIGTGAAGVSAAEAIRCRDVSGEITLLGEEPHGFYSRPGLAYYLNNEISEQQLFPFTAQDFRKLNLRMVNAQTVQIDPGAHQVKLKNGSWLPYDRLLIATGASAVRSRLPGANLEGVVKLDNLDDVRQIIQLARKARRAVVVGGGITALELVEGLRTRGLMVHYLLRGDRYWSNVLDESESQIVEQRLKEDRVSLHYHTELDEILGKNGRVSGVRTKDGRIIPCEIVGVAVGVQPRLELAREIGLKIERGILTDETLQTSQADIFAAGDVAQVYDPWVGSSVLDSLWGPARQQGEAAGSNMAGHTMIYRRMVAFNVTRLTCLTTTIIGTVGKGKDEDLMGIARGDSETWRRLPEAIVAQSNFEINSLRLLVGEQKLLGAVVMGDQTLSMPLQRMISESADISPVRDQLLASRTQLADFIVEFWTRWNNNHGAQQS